MGSTLPTQTGEQGERREGDVDVILEIWGIEPTFSTQSGARKMVVLSLYVLSFSAKMVILYRENRLVGKRSASSSTVHPRSDFRDPVGAVAIREKKDRNFRYVF